MDYRNNDLETPEDEPMLSANNNRIKDGNNEVDSHDQRRSSVDENESRPMVM